MPFILRVILLPIAPFWWLFAVLKRFVYGVELKRRYQSALTTMVVGNLSLGGTGKTPFSIYLVQKLISKGFNVAYLSRGYGRNTKGLVKVENSSGSNKVGDEALMVKRRFPEVDVVVCENRKEGLAHLEKSSLCSVVVMDDAYQHLGIKANHYFLLSTFKKPFYKDFIFPIGNLREPIRYASIANTIVITKSPNNVNHIEKRAIANKIEGSVKKDCFFTSIEYNKDLVGVYKNENFVLNQGVLAIVVTGIAAASAFINKISEVLKVETFIEFADHHSFSKKDLDKINNTYTSALKHANVNKYELIILTTEKDAARLQTLEAKKAIGHLPLFYWPINLAVTARLDHEIDKIIELKCYNR
ncbi:MAG: tetraacyldisaccharide 4'-kinase [Bacteroidia bacterium]